MILSKPVIAAISGYAVAGGFEVACWCDLRVVDQSAILGVYCRMRGTIPLADGTKLGVPLLDGGTIRLPRLIGLSRAMDIILTGYNSLQNTIIHTKPRCSSKGVFRYRFSKLYDRSRRDCSLESNRDRKVIVLTPPAQSA